MRPTMTQATKKPHEVTFAYLRRWASLISGNKRGLWYFDIERQELRFSTEASRHSFATERHLYMALVEGARDQSVERWFGEMETSFVAFLSRVDRNDLANRPPAREVGLALMCAVAFGYRSGFEIRAIEKLLKDDSKFRALYGDPPPEDAHRLAVENMVNVISRELETYRKMTVVSDLAAPLLVCDRPLLVLPASAGAYLPLGTTSLLQLDSAPDATEFRVEFATANPASVDLVGTMNDFTLKRARKWLAAEDKAHLEPYLSQLAPDLVAARRDGDKVEYTPPAEGQKTWWEIR